MKPIGRFFRRLLRDLFAACALVGVCSQIVIRTDEDVDLDAKVLARAAALAATFSYLCADAMLTVKEKTS